MLQLLQSKIKMCCVELGAHIQAFTFSSQDHGRSFDKQISQAFTLILPQDHGRLTGVWCGVCGVVCWCVVLVCCGGVCVLLCCGGACVW